MNGVRRLRIGAKEIAAFLGIDDVPKVNRLVRQNLIPGVTKFGRQYALDEELHVEGMRAKVNGGAK